MSNHTPGPWVWGTFHKMLVVPVIDGQPYKWAPICVMPSDRFPHDKEDVSNARLIASAPDLLEALQRYVAQDVAIGMTENNLYRSACAAIAKATGND